MSRHFIGLIGIRQGVWHEFLHFHHRRPGQARLGKNHTGGAVALAPSIGKKAAVLSNEVNANVKMHHLLFEEAITLMAITPNFDLHKATAAMLNHVAVELPTIAVCEISASESDPENCNGVVFSCD